MHYGVFQGATADSRPSRMLVLGESHHISTDPTKTIDKTPGIPASYPTAAVIQEHLDKSLTHEFLTKIVKSFGLEPSIDNDAFWQSVYFGNYIDVLCGIADSFAKEQILKNRVEYNDQLFRFVNDHGISRIFCFSILTYNNLPEITDDEMSCREAIGTRGKRIVYLRQCRYKPDTAHGATSIVLHKDLTVYGICHPSASGGFSPEIYVNKLKELL